LAGIKNPIYGGLAGSISAAVMSIFFSTFDVPTVLVLTAFGFGVGIILGRIYRQHFVVYLSKFLLNIFVLSWGGRYGYFSSAPIGTAPFTVLISCPQSVEADPRSLETFAKQGDQIELNPSSAGRNRKRAER
jgi:hypothetical protein